MCRLPTPAARWHLGSELCQCSWKMFSIKMRGVVKKQEIQTLGIREKTCCTCCTVKRWWITQQAEQDEGHIWRSFQKYPTSEQYQKNKRLGQFIFPASLGLLVHTPWGSWSQMRWVSQWWDPLPQAMGRAWCTFKAGCCLCHSYPQDKTAKGFWRIQLPIHLPKRKRLELLGSTGSFFQNFHQNILGSLTSSPHTA